MAACAAHSWLLGVRSGGSGRRHWRGRSPYRASSRAAEVARSAGCAGCGVCCMVARPFGSIPESARDSGSGLVSRATGSRRVPSDSTCATSRPTGQQRAADLERRDTLGPPMSHRPSGYRDWPNRGGLAQPGRFRSTPRTPASRVGRRTTLHVDAARLPNRPRRSPPTWQPLSQEPHPQARARTT